MDRVLLIMAALVAVPSTWTTHDSVIQWTRIDPSSGDHPGTTPVKTLSAPNLMWCFDANGETQYFLILVPDNWDGVSDMKIAVGWQNQSGTVIPDTETVIWQAVWYGVDPTIVQALNHGTAVTVQSTYTQSGGAGTDRDLHPTLLTFDYDHADQQITAGGMVHFALTRDFNADSYASDACMVGLKRGYYRGNL